jgi:hypothetical protein
MELFVKSQTKNVDLRTRIKNYFKVKNGGKEPDHPKWDMKNIVACLPSEDMLFLSVWDISITLDGKSTSRNGRADMSVIYDEFEGVNHITHSVDYDDGSGPKNLDGSVDQKWKKEFNSAVWSWLLKADKNQPAPKFGDLEKRTTSRLEDFKVRKRISEEYQKRLFAILNDSVSLNKRVPCRYTEH